MKLNRKQRAMVIEYFATQCAEEMPADDSWDVRGWHIETYWTELLKALGQTWRNPRDAGWDELVENLVNAMQLDRDPAGHLYSMGYDDTETNRDFWKTEYDDMTGMGIDAISSRAH